MGLIEHDFVASKSEKTFLSGITFLKGLKEWGKKFRPLTHLFSIRCCCCCCCCYCCCVQGSLVKKGKVLLPLRIKNKMMKVFITFLSLFFSTETEFVCSVLTLTGLRLNWWDGECEPFRCWLFSAAARHCHGYTAARAGRTEGGFCWWRRGGEIPHCCNSRRVKKIANGLKQNVKKTTLRSLSSLCTQTHHEHKQFTRMKERKKNLFIVFKNRKDIILFSN